MKKVIEYLKLPSFWAQVEQVRNPELNRKPFVIGSFYSESKSVLEVSENAKKEGIKKGMSLVEAKSKSSRLEVVGPNFDLYENIFHKIKYLLHKRYPVVEPEPGEGLFIDYSGLSGIYGEPLQDGMNLQKEIKRSFCLESIMGVSETKFVSRLASRADEKIDDCFLEVKRSEVKKFLAPWPVEVVPGIKENIGRHGVHEVCADLNLNKIKDLMLLPKEFLQVAFGEERAELIYACIHGRDFRCVIPQERKETLNELISFDEPTNDYLIILNKVNLAIEKLEVSLNNQKRFADSCVLVIRYSDYSKKNLQLKPRNSNQSFKVLLPLLKKMLRSRRLGVKDISLTLNGIQKHSMQLHLFEDVLKKQQLKSYLLKPKNNFIKKIS